MLTFGRLTIADKCLDHFRKVLRPMRPINEYFVVFQPMVPLGQSGLLNASHSSEINSKVFGPPRPTAPIETTARILRVECILVFID